MTTEILRHQGGGAWSRYDRDADQWNAITNPEPPVDDAPQVGYYVDPAHTPFVFKIGPFATMTEAIARADIEDRYGLAKERYERARDAAVDALYEVAAVLTDDAHRRRWLVQQLDEECDNPCTLPQVFATASDYLDDYLDED
jgi:thymidylate synthase